MGRGPIYGGTQRWENRPRGHRAGVTGAVGSGPATFRGDAAVVSHKATIRLLLSSLLGFDPRRYRDALDQNPCALNIVDFKSTVNARLTLFNDTSHYDSGGLAIPAVPQARLSKSWNAK